MGSPFAFTVFTKPWKMPLPELGKFVKGLGFDGIELPVRPGYQVEPENVDKGLPEAARILGDCSVKIGTVAGPTDEATIAACAEAGVPIIRICVRIDRKIGYIATEAALLNRAVRRETANGKRSYSLSQSREHGFAFAFHVSRLPSHVLAMET